MRPTARAALCAVGVLAGSEPARSACRYEVTIVLAPECAPHGRPPANGTGLNDEGAAVGWFHECVVGDERPFIWTPAAGFAAIEPPEGVGAATAAAVNGGAWIVGQSSTSGARAFVLADGTWIDLPPVVPDTQSTATDVSDRGTVVGSRNVEEDPAIWSAFTWDVERSIVDLGPVDGASTFASAVSDEGVVVGWAGERLQREAIAVRWRAGVATVLGVVPGGYSSVALDVNRRGEVVGVGRIEREGLPLGQARAFRWRDGAMVLLPAHDVLPHAKAAAVNDAGLIVGLAWSEDGRDVRAVLWHDDELHEIAVLLEGPAHVPEVARDVNARGQILCTGRTADGQAATLLLTPVLPPGDVDADCCVDREDVLLVLQEWGTERSFADLNGDGVVNFADLLIVLAGWS